MTHTLCYLSRIFHSKEFRFYLVIVCLCLPLSAMAQSKITGKVIDTATGETLIGATVQVKGTGKGTITDIEGNYSINASSDDKLIFSSKVCVSVIIFTFIIVFFPIETSCVMYPMDENISLSSEDAFIE